MIVFLQRRSAAGGIGDEGVEIIGEKDVDIVARQGAGLVGEAGVKMERAAAVLSGWNDHFTAIPLQDTDSGLVQAGERHIRDTAG